MVSSLSDSCVDESSPELSRVRPASLRSSPDALLPHGSHTVRAAARHPGRTVIGWSSPTACRCDERLRGKYQG